MKQLNNFLLLLILSLVSFSAQAWFFLYIPGKTVDSIKDVVTGDKGENCVGMGVMVGDVIQLSDGSNHSVISVSGKSSRCKQNPLLPIRALLSGNVNPTVSSKAPSSLEITTYLPVDEIGSENNPTETKLEGKVSFSTLGIGLTRGQVNLKEFGNSNYEFTFTGENKIKLSYSSKSKLAVLTNSDGEEKVISLKVKKDDNGISGTAYLPEPATYSSIGIFNFTKTQ